MAALPRVPTVQLGPRKFRRSRSDPARHRPANGSRATLPLSDRGRVADQNVPLCETWARMSHPDPNGAPDRRPIKVGKVWENPVTGEPSVILERPWDNSASRVTGELTALVSACDGGTPPSCSCGAIHRAGGPLKRRWTRGDSNPRLPRCERGITKAKTRRHNQLAF